jgi:hypothetical protein
MFGLSILWLERGSDGNPMYSHIHSIQQPRPSLQSAFSTATTALLTDLAFLRVRTTVEIQPELSTYLMAVCKYC